MMTKILVTGGAGFIGSHLVEALVEGGMRVRVLDYLATGFRRNPSSVWGRIEFFEGELCDPIRVVDQVCRVLKPGGIFFSCAPFYHPYHGSPHDYFRFTLEAYRHLLSGFSEVRFVSGGNYLAVLSDVLAYA